MLNQQLFLTNLINYFSQCGGPDLNRRTPTGLDPESSAFDQARQPPPDFPYKHGNINFFWKHDRNDDKLELDSHQLVPQFGT